MNKRCSSSRVFLEMLSCGMPRATAAMDVRLSSSRVPSFHLNINMALGSHKSLWAGSSSLSISSCSHNASSCTGCMMMSQSATEPHTIVVAHAIRRNICRWGPGCNLSESLRTTITGSTRSTTSSRQSLKKTATKRPANSADRAHKCQVFRCGKHTTSEMAAIASTAMHVNTSPLSGGNAASPSLGGERPEAATAARKATAETK
mmetsp:Transcript_10573/g.24053  ORF Transcript_10573/g.24053 Transcript_10573/m.24053 type:complete len:204 (+) Transcript_10573:564-1175(+)